MAETFAIDGGTPSYVGDDGSASGPTLLRMRRVMQMSMRRSVVAEVVRGVDRGACLILRRGYTLKSMMRVLFEMRCVQPMAITNCTSGSLLTWQSAHNQPFPSRSGDPRLWPSSERFTRETIDQPFTSH
jgi:hypothetical protein